MMTSPPSAKLLANYQEGNWIGINNMATWKPKGSYPDVSPYDGYMIEFPPLWSAYLKAKALEQPKPPTPDFVHSEPYFTIKKSAKGGLGAFANQEIPAGTVIRQESPLLSTSCGTYELVQKFRSLTDEQQSIFVSMASHDFGSNSCKLSKIFGVNCFRAGSQSRVFAICCRFNHACVPRNNVNWHWIESIGKIVLTTLKAVKMDDELTISYGHSSRDFPYLYGFVCDCGCNDNQETVEVESESAFRKRFYGGRNPNATSSVWHGQGPWRHNEAW